MSLVALPVELLDSICHKVAPADLAALTRTSTTLSPVARRLLYRDISVSAHAHNFSVVKTLAQKAGIAQDVRTFAISVHDGMYAFSSFYGLLRDALSNMPNLTSLRLTVDSHASWILSGPSQPTVYTRLEHFTCSFPMDHHVGTFLERTPNLLELEAESTSIATPPPAFSLAPTSIPRLIQYIGSPRVAKHLAVGRPLESIILHGGDVGVADIIDYSRTTAQTTILQLITSALPGPLLEALSQHMPHLSYLRVMTTYNFEKAPDADFYNQVANALVAFPDLTAFELSGIHWGSKHDDEDGNKRVWQSKPLVESFDLENRDDDIPIDYDLFFAY
ncbi:hypothetical protein PLICRDRAFT_150705 [Plicaturopsis crispa FD-325 SS-3]|nr:hypothetical protein PLICRDRAFT_150705 [Plicaturopsis crispa FD-325 SS-3]